MSADHRQIYSASVYSDPMSGYTGTMSGYKSPGFIKTRKDAVCFDYISFFVFAWSWFGSLVAMGLAIWILVDRNYFSIVLGQDTMTASAWLLALGGVIGMIVAIEGRVAHNYESIKAMFGFSVVQGIVFAMMLISMILAIVYKTHINKSPEVIRMDMSDTIRYDYGVKLDQSYNKRITEAYDETQEQLYCCAVDDEGWRTYHNSEWYMIQPPDPEMYVKPYVPISCCVKRPDGTYVDVTKCQTFQYGPPGYPNLPGHNEGLNYRGCFLAAKTMANDMTDVLIGTSACVSLLCILPALLFGLYMALKGIPALHRLNEKYKKDKASMLSAGGAFADMYGYS